MREFFKTWRRKAGVVTLGLACVFAAGWVRSTSLVDQLCFGVKSEQTIQSVNGSLRWWTVRSSLNSTVEHWLTKPVDDWQTTDDDDLDWRFRWIGVGVVKEEGVVLRIIRFRSLVIPLTLLSAYLLLSKPRPAKPTQPIEPDHE